MTVKTPGFRNEVTLNAHDWRDAWRAILGGTPQAFTGGIGAVNGGAHGVCRPGDLAVTQSATPGMSVAVAAGMAMITGTESAIQGPNPFLNDSVVTLAVSPGDATNNRHDLVVAQWRELDVPRLVVVAGTPAPTPVDPSLASFPNALVLARIVVEANESTSILNADVADLRTFASAIVANNAVTAAQLASNAVTASKIASNAVTTSKIADGAVTSAKIATLTGDLIVGGHPDGDVAGVVLQAAGRIATERNVSGSPNIALDRREAAAIGVNEPFITFVRAGAVIGSVRIASGTTVVYNTSSDKRTKQRTGDVDDAADIVQQLGRLAYRGRFIADEGAGQEWVLVNSQDVERFAPYAVQGESDAVDDDGNVVPQQLDRSALVPLLTAALSQALTRIEALESLVGQAGR